MKTQLLLIASSLTLFACVDAGQLGHISHPSNVALNIIPDHKLDLIADRRSTITPDTLKKINDDKTTENYKQNHKVTAICQKFYFAGSEATTDPANKTTTITFLNGEKVLYRNPCFIENANPNNSTYYSMSTINKS